MNWYKKKTAEAMFTSTGTIHVHGDDWVTIDVDPDIGRYYLSQFNRSRPMLQEQIMPPKWGPHISLLRGEEVQDRELLEEANGKTINFSYNPEVRWDGRHAYLDVESAEALELRKQLGLAEQPFYPLHLTFGVVMQI